jgi:nitrogen fixation protein NifU and related proteins
MYSPEVLDHFENPRNAGVVAEPDAVVEISNPACGDILKLSLKIKSDRIEEIRFQAKACVCSIACGSAITELVLGKSVNDARRVSREELIKTVGGLPPASIHAAHLAMDALAAALNQADFKK